MPSSYVVGEHFERFIKEQIRQGRYGSASEVVRDGLRTLEDRQRLQAARIEALRAELRLGSRSGPAIDAEQAFARLRRTIADVAAASNEAGKPRP